MTLKPDLSDREKWPRGMSRTQAATYVGVGPTIFDEMVAAGDMPKPLVIPRHRRLVWDRAELDIAFSELPHQGARNFFDRAS